MAKGSVTLECMTCGKNVHLKRTFSRRAEADYWEESMKDSNDRLCKDCYMEYQNDTAREEAYKAKEFFEFPKLEAKSPKQYAYAESIRNRVIAFHAKDEFKQYKEFLEVLDGYSETQIEEWAAHYGYPISRSREHMAERYNVRDIYIVLHETDGGRIIDELKYF